MAKAENLTGMAWTGLLIRKKAFLGAIQEYKNADGVVVPVCFTTGSAYVFSDEQGYYDTKEMEYQMKHAEQGFPELYDVYNEITTVEHEVITDETKQQYGLSDEDCADIISRLDALQAYTEEIPVKLG